MLEIKGLSEFYHRRRMVKASDRGLDENCFKSSSLIEGLVNFGRKTF